MIYKRILYFYGFESKEWEFGWWFVGYDCISIGFHVCLKGNIEIHLPFGYLVIGKKLYGRTHRDAL